MQPMRIIYMLKKTVIVPIFLLIMINPLYSISFTKVHYSMSTQNYFLKNSSEEIIMPQNGKEKNKQYIDNDIQKKNLCNTILGISYGSAMTGAVIGIVSGLCWAFSPKNKIASMAVCLTGCGLFALGTTAGLIISNVYCKKSDHYSNFHNKYDIILDLNFEQRDYAIGLSYKF